MPSLLPLDPVPPRAGIDPLELYAAAMDTSDYVAAVSPAVRHLVPFLGDLLDVGAGGGQLGRALCQSGRRWTAIEPAASMRARLLRLESPPEIVASDWATAEVAPERHDTVLAATMPATMDQPELFLARCRSWARRTVVWVVPAYVGPRGLCLAGCLPSAWHGEDETPGIDIVLRGLSRQSQPHETALATWTFSAVLPDLDGFATYMADRLGWPLRDERRAQLTAHLAGQAKPDPAGSRLEIFRRSAVLVWRLP